MFVDVDFPGMLLNLKIMAHRELAEFYHLCQNHKFIIQFVIVFFTLETEPIMNYACTTK